MKLLIATRNINKFKEFNNLFKDLDIDLISPSQVNTIPNNFDVQEIGQTFKQNAILKAKGFGQKANLLTIADDSGLSIDFLDGQPGIYSHRFAHGNFSTARKRILQLLKAVPQSKRTAQFTSVLALFDPIKKRLKTFTGINSGWISFKERGLSGFGYDSIFVTRKLNQTYAEISNQQKSQVSHRALAFNKLIKYLKMHPYD
jgi:XTP/dITP diphosphohydrolase